MNRIRRWPDLPLNFPSAMEKLQHHFAEEKNAVSVTGEPELDTESSLSNVFLADLENHLGAAQEKNRFINLTF